MLTWHRAGRCFGNGFPGRPDRDGDLLPGRATVLVGLLAASSLACTGALPAEDIPLERIELPPGFAIGLFATGIPDARSLALGERGTVFVGNREENEVYALVDRDEDGKSDETHVIASGLRMPNGVAFRDGSLYVAEVSRILRFDEIESRLDSPPEPVVVRDDFPTDDHHGWKFIAFGPDGKLYVPVGAPCNVCERSDERYASITRMNADGSDLEIFAHGVRNTVGFDWHPDTDVLWFTDNGRDWMGDNRPPDELNRAPRPGLHFGFPYCHGRDILDPDFGRDGSCDELTPPVLELGPHVAAVGMRFYTGDMFPEAHRGQIFIAEHGSWNRSNKIGYRVTLVRLEAGVPVGYEVFASGWLEGETHWGRPADVLVMPDGALLVSDDQAGAVYRITALP